MGSTAERVKTTAIVIAYLASFMVVAIPVGMAPTDSTPDTTVAESHVSTDVEFDMRGNETTKGDPIQVDTNMTLRVFNISSTPDNVTLTAPSNGSVANAFDFPFADFRAETGSDPHSDSPQEAVFPDIEFDEVGRWNFTAWDDNGTPDTSDDTIVHQHNVTVEPLINIDVKVQPKNFDFPGNRTKIVRVTATWQSNGSAVENADVNISNERGKEIDSGTTDADGKYSKSLNFWAGPRGSGTYDVEVFHPNSQNGRRQGTSSFTIDPGEARVVDTDGLPGTHGFTSNATWDVRFPTNDPLETQRLLANHQLADGNLSFWNVSHLEDGSLVEKLNISTGTGVHTSSSGNITVWPNGLITIEERWNNSDHTLRVVAERNGRAVNVEYEVETGFDVQAPADVNLRITPDNGVVPGRDLGPATWNNDLNDWGAVCFEDAGDNKPRTCRPTGSEDETTGTVSEGDTDFLQNTRLPGLGVYNLTILGDTEVDVPKAGDLELRVSGPHVGTPVFRNQNNTDISTLPDSWDIQNGIVNVTNVTPARGDSELTFHVDWDDQGSAQIDTRIRGDDRSGSGDVLTTETDEVTVGEETDVTFHVEDVNGNPIPEANLEVFWARNATEVAKISGNGTAGHGMDGDYTVSMWVNHSIGKVVAHSNDTQDRHAYAELEIVPAHDLDVDISPDEDLAGRDTEYTMNITRNGVAFDDGSAVDLWVLNEDEWADFQDNGSEALPATDSGNLTRDSTGNYTFDWQGAPGTYYVYVRTDKRLHDNVGQVPTIMQRSADIHWDPETLVSQVDTNVSVSVHLHDPTVDDHNASELNGTLALQTGGFNPGGGPPNATFWNGSLTGGTVDVARHTGGSRQDVGLPGVSMNVTGIDVTNGDAHIDNATAERPGPVYAWFLDDSTGAVYAMTSQPLQVVAPNVEISPDLICVGVTTQVTATVTHPVTGDAIAGANVTLRGGGLNTVVNDTTDVNGVAQVTIVAQTSSQVNVRVNGDLAATFIPKQCMSISFDQQTYTAGDTVRVTVSQRGNPDVQIQGATVLLDGSSVGTTGSDGSMTFEAPSAGTHLVRAQKDDFADATAEFDTEPATPPAQFSVSGVSVEDPGEDGYLVDNTYTVTGTVTNNGGETGTTTAAFLVDGAQTDSTTLTLDAGASQEVAFQWTPSSTGDVSLAISADGDSRSTTVTVDEEEPTVPGFEVLAVLAALGAAAVVLRRD